MERKTHPVPKPGGHSSAIELARIFGAVADSAETALNGDYDNILKFQFAMEDARLLPAEIMVRKSHPKNRQAVRQVEIRAGMTKLFSDRFRARLIVSSAHSYRGRRP